MDERRLYRALYERFRGAILNGELPAGTRLPSTRDVAAEAGVSRNTALLAYEQLLAEGYVASRTGRGTFVAEFLPQAREAVAPAPGAAVALSAYARRVMANGPVPPPERYRWDFRYGLPALSDLPRKPWARIWARLAARQDAENLGYGPPQGLPELRQGLAAYLQRLRAVRCGPENLVVVNGARQALDLIGRVLIDPGDLVALEEPHYPGAREAFRAFGAELAAVPVDSGGIDVARLRALPRAPKLVFVTPSHQLPLGAVMPAARRVALLDWAAEAGALIVEDDYNSEFRYAGRPIEALQALDRNGRVLYVGTLSKTLFPALRVGYVAAPPALVEPLVRAKFLADRHTPTILQAALAELIREGGFDRHLKRARALCAARRDALVAALAAEFGDAVAVAGTEAGLHVVAWLRGVPVREEAALVGRAAAAGVGVSGLERYYLGAPPGAGLILGYANLQPAEIARGIAALRGAVGALPAATAPSATTPVATTPAA